MDRGIRRGWIHVPRLWRRGVVTAGGSNLGARSGDSLHDRGRILSYLIVIDHHGCSLCDLHAGADHDHVVHLPADVNLGYHIYLIRTHDNSDDHDNDDDDDHIADDGRLRRSHPERPTPVIMNEFENSPQTLTISVGDSVRWKNKGAQAHNVVSGTDPSPDGTWTSPDVAPDSSWKRRFDTPGTLWLFLQPASQSDVRNACRGRLTCAGTPAIAPHTS